jgi:hypothetical protein
MTISTCFNAKTQRTQSRLTVFYIGLLCELCVFALKNSG